MSHLPTARALTWLLSGLSAVLVAAGPAAPDRIDVSKYPEIQRSNYEVFAVRCSKCHSLTRPINARLKGDEWKLYVKKMIRRPGSGINEEAGRQIYEFLKYYSTRDSNADGAGVQ